MNKFFIELLNCSWSVWFIYGIGCMFVCQNISNVVNESCSGIGCCQIDISKGMQNITLAANSFNKHTKVWDFNPCSFAFIRASVAGVLNVLNAIIWHIWHTKHQKTLLMRCAKSYKFWHIWTVLFHLWNGMDRCVKKKKIYSFLSLLYYFSFSLSLTFFLLSSTACSLLLSLPLPFFLFFLLQHLHSGFGFFFFFFSCHDLSLFLFLSRRRRRFWFEVELADWSSPIWSSARRSEALLARGSRRSLLIILHSFCRWWLLSLVIDWSVGLGFYWRFWVFFFFFFLRFLVLEFVGGSGDCGCSLWRWL